MSISSTPDVILTKKILPYLKAEDISALSITGRRMYQLVENAIHETLQLSSASPTALGKRLRDDLNRVGENICKASLTERIDLFKRLSGNDTLPEILFCEAKKREVLKIQNNERLSLKKNVTRQMRALQSQAMCLFNEGFYYEGLHALKQIRNRNRIKVFEGVFSSLMEKNKIKEALEIAYGIEKDKVFALFHVERLLREKWNLEKLKDVILAVEESTNLEAVSIPSNEASYAVSPLEFYQRLSHILGNWRLEKKFPLLYKEKLLEGLPGLKKINLAQYVLSNNSFDPQVIELLEKPFWVAFVTEAHRRVHSNSPELYENFYLNFPSLSTQEKLILDIRERLTSFPQTLSILDLLNHSLSCFEKEEHIEALKALKVL